MMTYFKNVDTFRRIKKTIQGTFKKIPSRQ